MHTKGMRGVERSVTMGRSAHVAKRSGCLDFFTDKRLLGGPLWAGRSPLLNPLLDFTFLVTRKVSPIFGNRNVLHYITIAHYITHTTELHVRNTHVFL